MDRASPYAGSGVASVESVAAAPGDGWIGANAMVIATSRPTRMTNRTVARRVDTDIGVSPSRQRRNSLLANRS